MSVKVKTYIKYISVALLVIIPFAIFQQLNVNLIDPSELTLKLFIVPALVATIFGSIIAHTVLLRFQLKQTQQSLIQEAKMASLGHLVKSVAHEINTPAGNAVTLIGVIKEHQAIIHEELQKERPQKDLIDTNLSDIDDSLAIMTESMKEISNLISSFKTISADNSDEFKEINLNDYIESLLNTFIPELNQHDIRLSLKHTHYVYLSTYPSLLIQVLSQCINNAIYHAFDAIEQPHIHINISKDDHYAIIDILDNGNGIDPKHLPKIFDPFTMVTRKKNHIGLGLSMVYNIVTENLKGSIEAVNTKEGGALFVIKIPFSRKV